MGITGSLPVARHFEIVKSWSWHHAQSFVQLYHNKKYDFSLTNTEVSTLLGCSKEDASLYIKSLSVNSEKCNAMTLLCFNIIQTN